MCDHINCCKECAYNALIAEFVRDHVSLDFGRLKEELEEMYPQFRLYCKDCEMQHECGWCGQKFCLCHGKKYKCCNESYCDDCIKDLCKDCYKEHDLEGKCPFC